MKSLDYAEAYIRYAVPVCVRGRIGRQVIPQIDAGIARKGHLWIGNERRQPGRLFHAGWAGRPAILIRSVIRFPSNILKKRGFKTIIGSDRSFHAGCRNGDNSWEDKSGRRGFVRWGEWNGG